MQAVSLGPGRHGPVLEAVAPADDRLEVRDLLARLASLLLLRVEVGEGVGDEDAAVRAEAVVVEVEVLEGDVLGEELDERRVGVDAEGVVAQVDGEELGEVEDGVEEEAEGLGDLVEEATREDVGEVRDLEAKIC